MKRLVIALALVMLTVSATAQLWMPILSGSPPAAAPASTYLESFEFWAEINHWSEVDHTENFIVEPLL